MLRHEQFDELCAAASIGQASPEELVQLEQHASQCDVCRQAYFDYLNLSAQQFAAAEQSPVLSRKDAQASLDSELFTRRFFERAEREGIQFSNDVGREVRKLAPVPTRSPRPLSWLMVLRPVAAVMVLAAVISGAYLYQKAMLGRLWPSLVAHGNRNPRPENHVTESVAVAPLQQRVAELTAANRYLQAQLDQINAELRKANDRFNTAETNLSLVSEDRHKVVSDHDVLEVQLKEVQRQLAQSEDLVASAQQEIAKARDRASQTDAILIAEQVNIHDLTEELGEKSAALEAERQLQQGTSDVTELMAARNLHIVDVVDTDPKGKTRPSFGRIFFTEGKSLIFYAYDLNEAKIQKTNYQYRVWAKKEGGDKRVQSLGVFYSDDKVQRRWAFKCDDPNVLSEIDSVFVTFEPAGSDPSHPKGANLMYAYLHGQPNHP